MVTWASSSEPAPGTGSIPPKHDGNDATQRSQNVPAIPLRVIVESFPPPPPLSEEQRAKEKRKNHFKWLRFGLEILALGGLVAYVCTTVSTNKIAENNLAFSKKSFAEDRRPWIWIETPQPFDIRPEKPAMLNFVFVNSGRSPAKARTLVALAVVDDTDAAKIRQVQQHEPSPFSIILAPNHQNPTFSTAVSAGLISRKVYDSILQGRYQVVAVGRVVYSDISDTNESYETWFCVFRLPNGAVSYCPDSTLNGMK